MKRNMSGVDRIIRLIVAIATGVLYYFGVIEGTVAYILLAVAAVFLLTGLVSICPLYRLMGIRTCKAS